MKSFKQLREECGCKDKERKSKKKTVEVMPQIKDNNGQKMGVKRRHQQKKYERMIKHIKRSYAKDGKLTKDEKSIAYATAWKHKNKNK